MDTDWKHIQSFFEWNFFWMKRLYIFSISIHLISLPFRGFNCEAISLFWEEFRNIPIIIIIIIIIIITSDFEPDRGVL